LPARRERRGKAAPAQGHDAVRYRAGLALLMNLALAGEADEAKHALQTLRRLAPGMSQNWIRQNAVWASADAMKRYVEAFRIAGLK